MFIYSIVLIFASIVAHNIYTKISKISTNSATYSSSIVTLSSNEVNNIKDINENEKIGILNDKNRIRLYNCFQEFNIKDEKYIKVKFPNLK